MRPILSLMLAGMISSAALAPASHAGYTGSQISNENDPSPGTPLYSGNIALDYNADAGNRISGAVELTGSANSDKTITLEGNIAIKAGEDYAADDVNANRNSGVWVGYSGEIEDTATGYDNISNANITLKTAGAGDQIVIDVYGRGSRGIAAENYDQSAGKATVTLDATASGSDIIINSYNQSSGQGISSQGNTTVNVIGNLVVSVAAGHGITAGGALDVGFPLATENNVHVTGTTKVTAGSGARGISTSQGGRSQFDKAVNITITENAVSSYGISATSSGSIYLNGGVAVKADQSATTIVGVYSTGSGTVQVTGQTDVSILGTDGKGIFSSSSGTLVFDGEVNVQAGRYGIDASAATITLKDKANITVVNAKSAANGNSNAVSAIASGTVYISGGQIANTGTDRYCYAIKSSGGSLITDYEGKAHTYTISGTVAAEGKGSIIDLKMNGQSSLTGKTAFIGAYDNTTVINLALTGQSVWNVTDNSAVTSLTLDGTSWLAFNMLDSGAMTFANITASSIALESGAVLQLLGVKSTDFDTFGRALTTFTASLLNAGTLTADGVKLVTEDNYELTYTTSNDGTFTVTGITGGQLFIPEPTTATLGLLGLASLLARRRRA